MLIVECWNGDFHSAGRRDFKCHVSVWDELLDLGRKHGWKMMGAIPAKMSYDNWIKSGNFTSDYDPIDYGYVKTFQRDDAVNLANALEIVLREVEAGRLKLSKKGSPAVFSENMTKAELEIANQKATSQTLQEFISFLRKGEFDFTFDD